MSSQTRRVSRSVVRRLSFYLRALEDLTEEGETTVSSQGLADRAGTSAAQVRKDLSFFGSFGKRGYGYEVEQLRLQLREILGIAQHWRVALVGAGRIGAALFAYPQLRERGFDIVTILDDDPKKIGMEWDGVTIRSAAALDEEIRRNEVEIAILTVPASAAQRVADALVESGIRGVLNFAPTRIEVPDHVAVHGVNIAVELESLSFAVGLKMGEH